MDGRDKGGIRILCLLPFYQELVRSGKVIIK